MSRDLDKIAMEVSRMGKEVVVSYGCPDDESAEMLYDMICRDVADETKPLTAQ